MATDLSPDRSAIVEKQVLAALIKLLFEFPFWGHVATTLKVHFCDNEKWLSTAATDGENLWFDVDFVLKCDIDTLMWVVAHEVAHVVAAHCGSGSGMEQDYWQAAEDYWVNHLVNNFKGPNSSKKGIGTPPKFISILYDYSLTSDMTTLQIYDELKRRGPCPMGQFDYHSKAKSENGRASGSSNNTKNQPPQTEFDQSTPADLTPEEIAKRRESMLGIVMRASASAGNQHCPIQFRKMVDDFVNPKVNWKSELEAYLQSAQTNDVTMMQFDESCWWTDAILPGPEVDEDGVNLVIAIDTSGSVSESMLRQFLSEVMAIMRIFREFKILIWCFADRVSDVKEFTPQNIHELIDYTISERGGTRFDVNWNYMASLDLVPDRFLVFTDGYPNGSWGNPVYCPTMFIIAGQNRITAPFGRTIYFPI